MYISDTKELDEMEETQEQTVQVELRKSDRRYKMIIPVSVEQKIRLACAAVPNKEWSGVLFYTYTGDFEHGNLTVTCRDILVMDIGSQAYTEWSANADVIHHMVENDLLNCQMGIIHSHNNMQAFFSGTDTNTLLTEGQDRNNIVSLIVNNAGQYVAAISRLVVTECKVQEKGSYQFFGEGERTYEDEYEAEDIYVEYFMFNIDKKTPKGITQFLDRLKEIMKPKVSTNSGLFKTGGFNPKGTYTNYQNFDNRRAPQVNTNSILTSNPTQKTEATVPYSFGKSVEPVFKPSIETGHFNQFNPGSPEKKSVVDCEIKNEFIDGLVCQIITGNVFFDGHLDIDNYVQNDMTAKFQKRFGTEVSLDSPFTAWVDGMLEFIVFNSFDDELELFNVSDRGSIVAEHLYDRFKAMPIKNRYVNALMNRLKTYVD